MEDMHGRSHGPQRYLLSEQGFEELKQVQDMLRFMAHLTYGDENIKHGVSMLRIPSAALHLFFDQVSAQIGDALSRLSEENGVRGEQRSWR